MAKQKKSLDDNMDDVFANWAVGSKAKQNLELYQPDKEAQQYIGTGRVQS